ncbi:hypothetical protein ACTXT7_003048 [Hymenolepis weldensis]
MAEINDLEAHSKVGLVAMAHYFRTCQQKLNKLTAEISFLNCILLDKRTFQTNRVIEEVKLPIPTDQITLPIPQTVMYLAVVLENAVITYIEAAERSDSVQNI